MRMDTVAKFGSACAVLLLPVLVEAAQNGAVDAVTGAYVVTVVAGADVTLSAEDAAALGTGVDLVKRGAGRLVIATNLKVQGWAGELRVEEGYLRAREVGALGTAAKGTVVSDGATFEVDGSAVGVNTSGFVSGEPFTISGRGMKEGDEEMGVIRNVANSQYPGISSVTMLGDCLYTGVEANGRLDVRSDTLDMNGHTLTVRGYFALTSAALAHPGHIAVESGVLCLEGGLTFNGGAENRLTVASGARVILQGAKGNLPWTLVLRDGAKVERLTYGSDEAGRNVWAGPVELVSGRATLVSSETKLPPLTFTGNITGAGGLNVTSTGNGVVRLMGTANTFTGGLTVSGNGDVWLESPGALPHGEGAGDIRLDHKDARLLARARADAGTVETGWSVAEYRALADNVQVVREGAAALLWNAAGETTTYDEAVSTDGFLGHAGVGTLRLGGDWATGDLMNLEGNLDVAEGAQLHLRFLDLAGGTMTVPGGALVYCHTNAYMGCAWPETAKLVVESGGCFMTSNESPTRVYSMDMGHPRYRRDASYRAVLELQDGASMTGRICVGTGMGRTDAAALYIRDGARFRSGGTGGGSDMNIGSDGCGYVEMAGWMQMPGWTTIGGGGNGRGVWVQKGGEAANTGDTFAIGSGGGRGEAYFSGGTFTADKAIQVGRGAWNWKAFGAHAALTATDAADVACKGGIDLAMQSNSVAALNLNGGVLQAKYIRKMAQVMPLNSGPKDAEGNYVAVPFEDNTAFVNFNGGTLRALQSGTLFKQTAADAARPVDAVYVYPGGAVFDTGGYACTIDVPLVAPTGQGIASIPLPEPCTVPGNYIGSPYVTISGDGTNAWAHAVFDSERGVVTGIEVTCPGVDYTWAKATLARGGWTNEIVLADLPLAANASGGLVKKGAGRLVLNAANTFAGPVEVAGGTLVAGNDRALPAGCALALTGGTFDGGGRTWTFGAVTATSGGVANVSGAITASSFTKTGPGVFDLEPSLDSAKPIEVREGTLRLPQVGPGLWEAAHAHATGKEREAEFRAQPVFKEAVSTSLVYLYTNGVNATSLWKDYMNVFYSGYIWNTNATAQTWTFAGVLDDGIMLVIDETEVFSNTLWTKPVAGRVTVAPGPHRFYVAAYNGMGGAGATGCSTFANWPARHGLVWNPTDKPVNADGTASTNFNDYVDVVDPDRGAVFSLTRDGYEPAAPRELEIAVAAGAKVIVGDGAYAFTTYRGLGDIAGSTSIRTWILDGAEIAAGKVMHVTGDLAFPEGASFAFERADRLPTTGAAMTIATVDGTVAGALPAIHVPGSGTWRVFARGHELKLSLQKGTMLILR